MKYGKRRRYGRRKRSMLKRRRIYRRKRVYRRRRTNAVRMRSANFPLGKRCFAKLPYIQQFEFIYTNVSPVQYSASYVANGLNSLTIAKDGFIDNRASKFLIEQFANYKVRGMSWSLTVNATDLNSTLANIDPQAMVFIPWTPGNSPDASREGQLGYLKQLPGVKFKMVNARSGRPWTKMKGYVSVRSMYGRNPIDDNFIGTVNALSTDWLNPTNIVNFKYGAISVNESALPSQLKLTGTLKTTYFCEFFNVNALGTE